MKRIEHLPQDLVATAKEIAYEAHNGQNRRGGAPYITHPKAGAEEWLIPEIGRLFPVISPSGVIDRGRRCDTTGDTCTCGGGPSTGAWPTSSAGGARSCSKTSGTQKAESWVGRRY